MIKNIILFLIAFYALSTRAQGLRELCENAYYATDYVKLHQYQLIVDWANISDRGLNELEGIIYGERILVLSENNVTNTTKTIFTFKEVEGSDITEIEMDLERLHVLSFSNLSCLYNI